MTQTLKNCILKHFVEVTLWEAHPSKFVKESKDSVVIDALELTKFWTFWNAKHVEILFAHDVDKNIIHLVNALMGKIGEKL